MAKAHRLKRMHLVYDKHAHTCCHYLQLEWYCTKARTRTLLTAHRWRNSIWVRMQTGGGMGARYGETGRALICQAAVHQWSVNSTHKPWGLGPDTLHPLSGCRHSPGPRHGGGLRAKATGRVNDAWPVGHAHTHTHTPAWCPPPLCVAPSDGKILFGIMLMWTVLSFGVLLQCLRFFSLRGICETAKKAVRENRKFSRQPRSPAIIANM